MSACQRPFDPVLLPAQPVERGVDLPFLDDAQSRTRPRLELAVSGDSARPVASFEPGAMMRPAINASARSRSREIVRLSSRGRSSFRIMPITAATWPCGSDRWISNTSSGRATTVPPCSSTRSPSTTAGGSLPKLASVRFLTLLPSR
jgi:hypothetical protein